MNKSRISGVYRIINKTTDECYIGSSKNIKQRWYVHKCCSSWKKQPNFKLYKDMAQYGLDNFIFEVIEETSNIREREQYWIDKLKPSYNSNRANGVDIEKHKELNKQYTKAWYKGHREEKSAYNKVDNNRLCIYEGETLTLHALTNRLFRQGVSHSYIEAKKYLV